MDYGFLGLRSAAVILAFVAGLPTAARAQGGEHTSTHRAGVAQGTPTCVGDCNGDAVVRIDELVTAANIATDILPLERCAAADANSDARVTVDEVVGAVGHALHGCGLIDVTPSATTTPAVVTATPIVTTDSSTATPTASSTPSATEEPEATATPELTATPALPTATDTATISESPARTPTAPTTIIDSPTPTQSAAETPATPTRAGSVTRTGTLTRTPTNTRIPTRTPSPTNTRVPTRTPSVAITRTPRPPTNTPTVTVTRTATVTRTPTRTRTGTITAGPSATPTATRTPRLTPTLAGTPGAGPVITYFGIARADGFALDPTTMDGEQRPVFERLYGNGMILVLEARPGGSRRLVGDAGFRDGEFPDLQLLVSQALGDGRPDVCDLTPPDDIGGIPAMPSLSFDPMPAVINATNDLGCRLDDGTGHALGRRNPGDACTRSNDPMSFGYGFVDNTSTIQFCLPIANAWQFHGNSTIVAARIRDTGGNVSTVREIVVHVGS